MKKRRKKTPRGTCSYGATALTTVCKQATENGEKIVDSDNVLCLPK